MQDNKQPDRGNGKQFRGWKPAINKGIHAGCLCCPGTVTKLSMKTRMYSGFGGWMISRNKKLVYMGDSNLDFNEYPTILKFENMARKDPNANWLATIELPLRGGTYQRHGKNLWVLIESNQGFA